MKKFKKSTIKYIVDIFLLITFLLSFITGLIKFTAVINLLNINPRTLPMYEISLLHDYSSITMGFLILFHLVLEWKWLKGMTKKQFAKLKNKRALKWAFTLIITFVLLFLIFSNPEVQKIIFRSTNTIMIEGVGDYEYDPNKIETTRPDIFNDGYFSIFDILVYLDNEEKIDMNYNFDETMNTHVIEDINGKENWWHMAYYDGGWPEDNAFRMDHYPYKEKIYIEINREDEDKIQRIYDVFREEVRRKEKNGGKVIIPKVIIRGEEDQLIFYDVEVQPHDLRSDVFKKGIVTAIDVIMTLGDEGRITYDLQWYSSIGTSEINNYYVEEINGDRSHDRCGFVYEEGSNEFPGFSGNHIHIPPDIRVLNSPEYEEWFWICI